MKRIPLFLALLALSGCQKSEEQTADSSISFVRYFTDVAPPSPQQIHLVRAVAKPGEPITISGIVMGREKPFVDGRAAFVLGDPSKLESCDKMAMEKDHCKTPWDNCCATPEARREGTATVQIVGEDGRVLKRGLKGVNGLKELSQVSVTGIVDKSSTPDSLIINATAINTQQ